MATGVERQARFRRFALLAVIVLVSSAGAAGAMEASASHDIAIRVAPLAMLDVDNSWRLQSDTTDADGNRAITFVSTYGVTCNVPGSTIWGSLESSVPVGVRVRMQMVSRVGRSTGWHTFSGPSSVELVREPRGAEFSQVEVVVEMDSETSPESVNMEFAFRIE